MEGFKQGVLIGIIPARRYDGIDTEEEMQTKVAMIKRVYEDYCIPYVDLYYASNIRQADLRATDNVHLLEEAYKKMTMMVRACINSH
jgi:lysophospholipase L1-like esterase